MNVAELLESRQKDWLELENLVNRLKSPVGRFSLKSDDIVKFTGLYRAACADLALSEAYQLPPGVVRQLNDLVGRAHNQLYTDQSVGWRTLPRYLFYELPKNLFSDMFFWGGMLMFFGPMFLCAALAFLLPDFAQKTIGQETLDSMERMYSKPLEEMGEQERTSMYGFYIYNNAGIGLQVFAFGAFFAVGGIFITIFNAVYLGTVFGHMATVPQAATFFEFVTAHGPFELTAIAMSAGAGLRIGFSMVMPDGRDRMDAVTLAARRSGPFVLLAVFFFGCAAFIEAFISPNPLEFLKPFGIAPLVFKRGIALLSAGFLIAYIMILGGFAWMTERRVKT
ncbi:MAG: stage II sporulation protein M [Planctomycetaceae bacterium]|jgi:uncharacterized membrane protein SpoIIM required for sporulation|nr:stage II sporulation protein M [Planctomycetaceae bacterium]